MELNHPAFNLINHPVIHNKMSLIRDKNTGTKEFRELISEVSILLCYESLREEALTFTSVETPVGHFTGKIFANGYAIIPIYRAGLGMEQGIIQILPNAKVGHIGMYRDPSNLNPVTYYNKLPSDILERKVLLLDPMLATGGTAAAGITILKESGIQGKDIKFLCIVSCDDGVHRLEEEHPDVPIYSASHDEYLNSHAYIVPGLGDAGDRIFGTK